jgi:hypothetical protein
LTGPNGIITRVTSVFYFIRLQSGGFSFKFKGGGGKFFKNHVTLGNIVNGQKLLGTDLRKRYKKERSTVKLK